MTYNYYEIGHSAALNIYHKPPAKSSGVRHKAMTNDMHYLLQGFCMISHMSNCGPPLRFIALTVEESFFCFGHSA